MSVDYKRYSVWVYEDSNPIQVFDEYTPNTTEIWFEFYDISLVQWKRLEEECLQVVVENEHEQSFFYNFNKIKIFCLKYLLRNTNYPIDIVKGEDGLTKETMDKIFQIHPRILRELFYKVSVFEGEKTPEEEKKLAKECALIFGAGKAVNNPHKDIILYCDLLAFWEKFGLNYFDVQRLPRSVFYSLKKMMNMDNDFKARETSKPNNSFGGGKNKRIVF